MSKQTPQKQELFARTLGPIRVRVLLAVMLLVLISVCAGPSQQGMLSRLFLGSQTATAATTNTINFQARLQNAAGAIAPDGSYNVEFKLYNVSSGGAALWTEDYLNSATQGVTVKNGYLTVSLGSITAFPGTINWDQQLWLTMTVRGTGSCTFASCTPADLEMSPRLQLTGSAYAFRAGQLAQFNSGSGFTSTLSLNNPTVGNQVFQIQDQGAAGTYNLLTQTQSDSRYIQNQNASAQTTSNFWISGTGKANLYNSVTGYQYNGTAGVTTTACTGGQVLTNVTVQGGIVTGAGTCAVNGGGVSPTLQNVYDNSATTPLITLSTATGGGIIIKDASTTVGGNLLSVKNNASTVTYFDVTTSGVDVAGTLTATTVNANSLQTNGATRIDSSGNFTGGTISSGAITSSSTVQGTRLISTVANGTAPLTVSSATVVTNLNADLLDGINSTAFLQSEADTLATVTSRGATTSTASSFTGGATIRGLTVDSATATNDKISIQGTTIGATSFTGIITNSVDLTAVRTWSLPDASGTFITTGNLSGITAVGTVASGTWQGTAIDAAHGGTGQTSYTVGDLLYASGASTLSRLADVASGSCLVSGGVGVAPAWGSCGTAGANTSLSNLSAVNIGTVALNSTSNNLNLTTTTSGNIVLNAAGTVELQDATNVTGNLGVTGTITGSSTVQGTRFISTQVTGTAPLTVASTTVVTNLNADMVDGLHASSFQAAGSYLTAEADTLATVTGRGASTSTASAFNGGLSTTTLTASTGVNSTGANGYQISGTTVLTSGRALQNVTGYTQSSGTATFNQNAADQFKVIALQAPTTDMVNISNAGFPITTDQINGQQIDYYAALGTSGNQAAGARVNITNTSAVAGTVTNGIRIVATGAVAGTTNGLKIDNFTSGAGGASALYLGTGWKDLLSYNGTQLINGTGILQSAAVSGSYSGITGVGTLTAGTWQGTNIDLAHGGTNASLTASNGGIVYSTGSALAILAGTATAGQCLLSGSNAAPSWGSCGTGFATTSLNNLAAVNIGTTALNSTSNNLNLTTTTSGNIVLNSAGTIELQDATNVTGNLGVTGTITGSSTIQGTRFISTQATGTAPFTVASTTVVTNLNADMVDGLHASSFQAAGSYATTSLNNLSGVNIGTVAINSTSNNLNLTTTTSGNIVLNPVGTVELQKATNVTGNLGVTGTITGSSTIQGTRFISTQATGTAPFTVASTTVVTNLNADMVDGLHASSFQAAGSYLTAEADTLATVTARGATTSTASTFNGGLSTTTLSASGATTLNNTATVQTGSTSAFRVQNANGAAILGVDTSSTSTNMIANPSFEANDTGWAVKGSATKARITSPSTAVYDGIGAESITTTAVANQGISYAVALSANTTYTVSAYVRLTTGTFGTINLGRQDVSGTDAACTSSATTTTASGWSQLYCTFTTGATITSSNIFIKQTDAVARTIYVDDFMLNTGTTINGSWIGKVQLTGVVSTPVLIQGDNDSTSAFQIQDSSGNSLLNIDTLNDNITLSVGAINSFKVLTTAGAAVLQISSVFSYLNSSILNLNAQTMVSASSNANAFVVSNGAGVYTLQADTSTGDVTINNNLYSGKDLSAGFSVYTGGYVLANERLDKFGNLKNINSLTGSGALTINSGPSTVLTLIGGTGGGSNIAFDGANYNFANMTSSIGNGTVCMGTGGNIYFKSGTAGCTTSSIAYKQNVANLGDALGILGQLRPVSFDWKTSSKITAADGGLSDFGLIAQDVYPILPQLIDHDADGTIEGLNYIGLIPFTIRGIQQQQGEITDLQGSVASLNSQTSSLSGQVATNTATNNQQLSQINSLQNNVGALNGQLAAGSLSQLVVSGNANIGSSLTVTGPTTLNGTLVAKDAEFDGVLTVNGHIVAKGNAPVITVGDALGAGTVNQPNTDPLASVDGTDSAGTISVTTGATQSANGVLAHLTFAQAFNTSYKTVVSASNDNASDLRVYIVKTSSGFDLVTKDTPAAGTNYQFDYIVLGAQQVASN